MSLFPSIENATVLITGASSGIGEVFAREMAQAKCRLILTARREDKLKELAGQLNAEHGIETFVIPEDLGEPDSASRLYEWTQKHHLEVDILVNNAGFGQSEAFHQTTTEKNAAMSILNMHSLVLLTHLFLKPMLEKKKGGIINIASTAAFQPIPYLTLYAATKAFVLSFTEGLWGECQPQGIRVLCLCPGNTRTAFHQEADIPKEKVFLSASAEDVVRFGLRVFQKSNRPTAVFGILNSLLAQGYRLMPRSWILGLSGSIYKKNLERISNLS